MTVERDLKSLYILICVCLTACFCMYLIKDYNEKWDSKIRSIDKKIYILKFPNGSQHSHTIEVLEISKDNE